MTAISEKSADKCSEDSPYINHLAGTRYCVLSGSVEFLDTQALDQYEEEGVSDVCKFTYCPFCGKKLQPKKRTLRRGL